MKIAMIGAGQTGRGFIARLLAEDKKEIDKKEKDKEKDKEKESSKPAIVSKNAFL